MQINFCRKCTIVTFKKYERLELIMVFDLGICNVCSLIFVLWLGKFGLKCCFDSLVELINQRELMVAVCKYKNCWIRRA